jgi:hypothetical protein
MSACFLTCHPFFTVDLRSHAHDGKVRTRNFSLSSVWAFCLHPRHLLRLWSPRPRLLPPPWTTPLLVLEAQQAQGVARLPQPLRLTAARAPPWPGRPLPPPTHCLYLISWGRTTACRPARRDAVPCCAACGAGDLHDGGAPGRACHRRRGHELRRRARCRYPCAPSGPRGAWGLLLRAPSSHVLSLPSTPKTRTRPPGCSTKYRTQTPPYGRCSPLWSLFYPRPPPPSQSESASSLVVALFSSDWGLLPRVKQSCVPSDERYEFLELKIRQFNLYTPEIGKICTFRLYLTEGICTWNFWELVLLEILRIYVPDSLSKQDPRYSAIVLLCLYGSLFHALLF